MKRLAILLALLAMPAIVGCGSSSDGKTASAKNKNKNKQKKSNEKSRLPKPGTHPKGYKEPQNVFGPTLLESYLKNLKNPDAKERERACVGLFNQRSRAREALPELKRLAKNDKDKKVRDAAKRAIKAIEEG